MEIPKTFDEVKKLTGKTVTVNSPLNEYKHLNRVFGVFFDECDISGVVGAIIFFPHTGEKYWFPYQDIEVLNDQCW